MRWIYLYLVFAINSLCAGEIIVTNDFGHIEDLTNNLDASSLVLFDVDATLIVPNDAILKPHGRGLFERLIVSHTERDLFRDIRMKASHSLVDVRSIDLVHALQQKKIPVLALTAAPAKIKGVEPPGDWRVNELKHYGFDFSEALPNCHFMELQKDDNQQHHPLYKSGVLYSSFHSKGVILVAFLQRLDLKPTLVIFVDDELKHVQSVVSSLKKEGISCVGVHYTAVENMPCELDPTIAQFQVEYFICHDEWLSDEQAKNFLRSIHNGS